MMRVEEQFEQWFQAQSADRVQLICERAAKKFEETYWVSDLIENLLEDAEYQTLLAEEFNQTWIADIVYDMQRHNLVELKCGIDGVLAVYAVEPRKRVCNVFRRSR